MICLRQEDPQLISLPPNRYKLCFMALDGMDKAEMICFSDVARCIIINSVQQVLRTSTSANTYLADIARMVSLRFTFVVTLT